MFPPPAVYRLSPPTSRKLDAEGMLALYWGRNGKVIKNMGKLSQKRNIFSLAIIFDNSPYLPILFRSI
jgi:hypothetical protein